MLLATKISNKASTIRKPASGRGMNGVTLDQRGKASLESLVSHYAKQDPGLFSSATVQMVGKKLPGHRGPKFHGPWP